MPRVFGDARAETRALDLGELSRRRIDGGELQRIRVALVLQDQGQSLAPSPAGPAPRVKFSAVWPEPPRSSAPLSVMSAPRRTAVKQSVYWVSMKVKLKSWGSHPSPMPCR